MASPLSCDANTSRSSTPGHRCSSTRSASTAAEAMRQPATSCRSWERCLRSPIRPASSTPKRTARPPSEPVGSAGNLLDLDSTLDTGKPSQLLDHKVGLQSPLSRKFDVLPVTASASARACEWTWRSDSLRGGTDDLERVRPQVGLGLLGDGRDHTLARQTMANEHDTTVAGSRDTAAPGRDRARLKLKQRKIAHEPTNFSQPAHLGPLFIVRPVQCAYSQASSPCRCPVARPSRGVGGGELPRKAPYHRSGAS